MPELTYTANLYRDDRGRLRLTSSGHYRFDLMFRFPDGTPFYTIRGIRLDLKGKRILPVTIPSGNGVYVVGDLAPGQHDQLVKDISAHILEEINNY